MIHSQERLEAFSDAVFAFAATLIVVSFEIPDDYNGLMELMSGFVSFGLSFLALILIWKVHYNYFRRIQQIDNTIISMNMLLLFVVLFYVYPMKFLANSMTGKARLTSFDQLASVFIIYGIGFVLIFSFIAMMYWYAARKETVLNTKMELNYYSKHFSIFIAIGFVSILLAYLQIGIHFASPGFVYAMLGPLCYWYGKKYGLPLST